MAIYLLQSTDDSRNNRAVHKVVCAGGERQARAMAERASLKCEFEPVGLWVDDNRSNCIKLDPAAKGVVCSEYV